MAALSMLKTAVRDFSFVLAGGDEIFFDSLGKAHDKVHGLGFIFLIFLTARFRAAASFFFF